MKELLFECTVPGRAIVKKNQQRVVGVGKGKRVIYSEKFVQWEKQAIMEVYRKRDSNLILTWVEADYKFYFTNQQGEADVSNLVEGIQDVLTKCGIIQDDRLVKRFTAEKFFGSEPRLEVKLYKYE